MYDTEGNKHHTCIHDNLLNCQHFPQHIQLKRKETGITVYEFKNVFCEKKLLFIENSRIKSLSCFKY